MPPLLELAEKIPVLVYLQNLLIWLNNHHLYPGCEVWARRFSTLMSSQRRWPLSCL